MYLTEEDIKVDILIDDEDGSIESFNDLNSTVCPENRIYFRKRFGKVDIVMVLDRTGPEVGLGMVIEDLEKWGFSVMRE